MNKYEKRFLLPLRLTTVLYFLVVLVNIVLPLAEKFKFTFMCIPQLITIGLYSYAILGAWGYLGFENRPAPFPPMFIVRSLQAWGFCYMLKDLTFQSLFILLGFDVLYLGFLFYCKARYVFCLMKRDTDGNLVEINEDEKY